jgi:hypothetical protein
MKLRMAEALLGLRQRREAAAKTERTQALAAVAAAEAARSDARARLVEAVDRSKTLDTDFQRRVAGGLVSAAAFDAHRAALRRLEEHVGQAVAVLREAEAAKARAEEAAEIARMRHVQALRSVDVGKTMRTRLKKAEDAKQESAAETDVEDLTIARFVTEGETS